VRRFSEHKDSNVEAIDLNFASAEYMILSATATGFVVWDRTASKAKEVRLSVLETLILVPTDYGFK
jgi:hypothetical protein